MSRRKCRLSPEELNIHEKAVKLRKMTDNQLVEYVSAEKQQPMVMANLPVKGRFKASASIQSDYWREKRQNIS